MKNKRSRLARVGGLTLALCLAVGLVSGSVADAKKKKKKPKGASSVTIAQTTPTTLPPATPEVPAGCEGPPTFDPCTTPGKTSLTSVPLTVGNVAKGKVVSLDSVSITFTITGSPRTGAGTANDVAAAAFNVNICLTAPNGRTVCPFIPGDINATTVGPLTITPDSPFGVCPTTLIGTDGTTTFCGGAGLIGLKQDPEKTVGPPSYAGTIGDNTLAFLGGVPAQGTWTFKLRNTSTMTPATVSNVSATIGLAPSPTSSTTGGKKKKK
jgi:hypothetical protein